VEIRAVLGLVQFAAATAMLSTAASMIFFGYLAARDRAHLDQNNNLSILYPISFMSLLVGGACLLLVAVITIFFNF
jgi:hypothetical protein